MAVELPSAGEISAPEVPPHIKQNDARLYEYLQSLKRQMEELSRGLFDNTLAITTAINSGTSGTFTLSSGGSIIITSGIVITVTS